jgi:type VI secretion system Hcp family effector
MAYDAYLFIDEIPGDSTSTTWENAKPSTYRPIEIKSYGLSIEMPVVENRSATGAATIGRANFNDFECEKNFDGATPHLLFHCLAGKHIKNIYCLVFRSTEEGADPTLFLKIHYQDNIITEVGVSGGGDELPKENLKFSYGTVNYEYTRTDLRTGKKGAKATFVWDRIKNTGTKS